MRKYFLTSDHEIRRFGEHGLGLEATFFHLLYMSAISVLMLVLIIHRHASVLYSTV